MKSVEHLDLVIRVHEALEPLMKEALEHFMSEHETIVVTPRFKDSILKINSYDFIALLGYLKIEDSMQLDLKRFFRSAESALQGQLGKALNPNYQYHYKWCLSGLKNFPIGRYLHTA